MVSKKALEYKIEQMEKEAARYGVTFAAGRDHVGSLGPTIIGNYETNKNAYHSAEATAHQEKRRALETVMDLMDLRPTYEQHVKEIRARDGYAEISLRYFLDDLNTVADSVEAQRLQARNKTYEKDARRRLAGKEPKQKSTEPKE
jgi:hypothetical protein